MRIVRFNFFDRIGHPQAALFFFSRKYRKYPRLTPMTPIGMKILLYFMVVIMNAPLPAPSKTTASGNTQHKDATNAEARLTMPDFMSKIRILTVLPKRFFVIVHRRDRKDR
jgi:hypothetical protein